MFVIQTNFKKSIDKVKKECYTKYCNKTVDAEIKPFKTAQRARGAGIRARHCLANGPLRAQSKEITLRVFCDVWQA